MITFVISTGRSSGITMKKNIRYGRQPSATAASSSSLGMDWTKPEKTNTLTGRLTAI
ncbi:hypothetical protein D3C81_2319450 [compost metagenome]